MSKHLKKYISVAYSLFKQAREKYPELTEHFVMDYDPRNNQMYLISEELYDFIKTEQK